MTELIEVKVSELSGAALDWAVAQIDEVRTIMLAPKAAPEKKPYALFGSLALPIGNAEEGYAPSTCWHCGGPLIARLRVTVHAPGHSAGVWASSLPGSDTIGVHQGSTALIAACRAIVASVLGPVVSVPKELYQ